MSVYVSFRFTDTNNLQIIQTYMCGLHSWHLPIVQHVLFCWTWKATGFDHLHVCGFNCVASLWRASWQKKSHGLAWCTRKQTCGISLERTFSCNNCPIVTLVSFPSWAMGQHIHRCQRTVTSQPWERNSWKKPGAGLLVPLETIHEPCLPRTATHGSIFSWTMEKWVAGQRKASLFWKVSVLLLAIEFCSCWMTMLLSFGSVG